MGLRDGIQTYFERFPDQLKVLYDGKEGFIYRHVSAETLKNTRGHSWESSVDVPVVLLEHIHNVYAEILKEEAAGNVMIRRYADIDPDEQKEVANHMRDGLNDPLCFPAAPSTSAHTMPGKPSSQTREHHFPSLKVILRCMRDHCFL